MRYHNIFLAPCSDDDVQCVLSLLTFSRKIWSHFDSLTDLGQWSLNLCIWVNTGTALYFNYMLNRQPHWNVVNHPDAWWSFVTKSCNLSCGPFSSPPGDAQSLGTFRYGHTPFISFILLPIIRDSLLNSTRMVLVTKSYIEIGLNFLK